MNFGEVFNMKKRIPQILILIQSLMFLSCEMDPAYSTKPDSYYFNKMQPLEWKDTYILTATNTPQQIQVWDSEKGKLVHTYSLSTDVTKWGQGTERALDINSMTFFNGSIWFIATGMQRNFIKLDIETGKMNYIDLDCIPSEVVTIHEYNDGVGCIYVSTRADSRVGVAIRLLDSNCNTIMKSNVKFKKINLFSIRNPIYENGKFYLLASRDVVFTKENNECFNLIIINDDGSYEIFDIKTDEILNEKFFDTYLNKNMQSYFTSFNLLNKLKNSTNKYSEINISDCNSDYFSRVLYNINSLEPFDITYTGIKYDKQDARSIYSIEKYEDNIFMTGRILYDENLFNGLETGLYPAAGGEQQKRVRLPNANQLYCTMKEDCAWFSKDLYTQDAVTLKWDKSNTPQIYKLDYKEQQVYQYNADGSYTILDWIQD